MASRRLRRTKSFTSYLGALTQDLQDLKNSASSPTTVNNFSVGPESLENSLVLNNKSIESASYIEGISGWKIDGTGVAEFSDVFVRGDINASSGTIGYWNISNPDVVRRIGNRDLYGTFLESSDLGASDYNKDSGTYVGLYKSYIDEEVAIVSASRKENVVTAVCPGHRFRVSDLISVDIPDDVSMSTGKAAVRVIEANYNNFKYISLGADVTELTGENYSGTAILNNKDVAGLYLQDYGRSLFDYGYFSNEGVSYVSAETPNLVYNASFEYVDDSNITVFSSDSWVGGTLTPTSYAYSSTNIYNGDSTYGGKLQWTSTALSTYTMATVNASEFKRLDFYKNDRELYLNFDAFFVNNLNQVTIPTTNSFATTSSSVITITCPGHGLAVDDLVYLDFNVIATGYYNYTSGYRIHTVLSVSGDSFTIQNKHGSTTSNVITLSARWSDNPCIFKYTQPIFDLNDIKIGFVTNTSTPTYDLTTSIYDVLTDVTISNWGDYRYWTASINEFDSWYMDRVNTPYRTINSMGITAAILNGEGSTKQNLNIKISSAKLEAKYRSIAGTQYLSDTEFYLCFPEWVWHGTQGVGNAAPIKRNVKAVNASGIGYILDNVSLSPSKKFFYGDFGSTSFYYKFTSTDTTKTNKVSYEAPRQWLDIDLDYQTAELRYMDLIEFKSSDFLKQLYINPGLNTIKNSSTGVNYSGESLLIGESSAINLSSGIYKYLTAESTYRDVEAYFSAETGTNSAVISMYAVSSTENANGPDAGKSGAGMFMSVDSDDKGLTDIRSDRLIIGSEQQVSVTAFGESAVISLNAPNTEIISWGTQMGAWVTDDFAGFYKNSTAHFGIQYNGGTPKVWSSNIRNNELTSNYSSVAISTVTSQLGYISSSITTKKNIEPLQFTIDSILAVEPVQFNYKSEEDGLPKHAGFIAEQLVEAGLNDYVSFDESGTPVTVNYDRFVSALQSVVRHQATQIADLNSRLSALEGS